MVRSLLRAGSASRLVRAGAVVPEDQISGCRTVSSQCNPIDACSLAGYAECCDR